MTDFVCKADDADSTSADADVRPRAHGSILVAILAAALAFNSVDRLALGLLLQDIKLDLGLSDTQLGLLSGLAFALFYSTMGIPIARWADRGNRVTLLVVTTALWSAAVVLCGFAANFVQLLVIRIGAAVGEAGLNPPAHSLIADHFPRSMRSRAMSRYMLGGPFSLVIGYFLAGWLNTLFGWRITFILLGLPGLLLVPLIWFGIREPRNRATHTASPQDLPTDAPTITAVCGTLWRNRTFRHLLLCFAVTSFFNFGILKWQPAFFIRSFGISTVELGAWFALIHGAGGIVGTFLGGEIAHRFATGNERLQLRLTALAYVVFGGCSAMIYLSASAAPALLFLAAGVFGMYMTTGPIFALIQTLAPPRMRGMAIASVYLFANFIGMGFGPLIAGILSDLFHPKFGEESLRYALLVLTPGYLWGAWHLLRASRTVDRDISQAQAQSPGQTG